jgi:outer membrane protein assembly factor BamA
MGARGQTSESTLPAPYGGEIVSIFYTSDGPVDPSRVQSLVELAVGKPLTEEATGETIRNLFATRRFADVQIEAQPVDHGVSVIVHLFRAYQVKPLKFTGKLPLAREDLRPALSFGEGSLFQQSAVDEGTESLERRLEQEGFLRSRVTAQVILDRATFDAMVVYRLDPGPRAKVARIFFDGDTQPFTPDELVRRGKLRPGTTQRVEGARGAAKITQWLHKNSWLRASVDLIAAQPTDDSRIMPVYRVTIEKVLFETRGVKASRVLGEIRIDRGPGFRRRPDPSVRPDQAQQLRNKGHYKAKVDTRSRSSRTATVTIIVDEGPLRDRSGRFRGNASVDSKKLLSLMVTHKPTFR